MKRLGWPLLMIAALLITYCVIERAQWHRQGAAANPAAAHAW
jgi:hypothetical protein